MTMMLQHQQTAETEAAVAPARQLARQGRWPLALGIVAALFGAALLWAGIVGGIAFVIRLVS